MKTVLRILLVPLLALGIMASTTGNANANAISGAYVYNFWQSNTVAGIVSTWTSPNTYQYVLSPGQWDTRLRGRGVYTGQGYCTDVYYNWGGGWIYQWTVRGGWGSGRYDSFAIQYTDYVGVRNYYCGPY